MDTFVFKLRVPQFPGTGEWSPLKVDGKSTATVWCPNCAKLGSLADHVIADDGMVSPSLVCPHDDCDFHRMGRLEGWKP